MASTKRKRYEHKITLGKDINGNLLRKSFYSTKSKADAKRKAEKYKTQYELELLCGGEPVRPRVLFKDWAPKCLELYKKPFVKANTYSGTYLAPVNNHLIPYFGKMEVNSIKPMQIQEYVNKISEKYAPETIKKDITILSFIFQQAVENGICKRNPVLKVIRLPKIERANKRSYTQEEYDKAYVFAKEHPNGLAIMLMMETGISRSELLGLRWEDVDVDGGVIHIRQGLVSYQNADEDTWTTEVSGLKNAYRRRDVPIVDDELLARLAQKPRFITLKKKDRGLEHTIRVDTEYVFHSPEGRAYQPNNWRSRVFMPFMLDLQKAHPELPLLSAHELRHTRATLWLAQGISPLMVAKLLGHSDTRMLIKVYDHTTVDTLREVIKNAGKSKKEAG